MGHCAVTCYGSMPCHKSSFFKGTVQNIQCLLYGVLNWDISITCTDLVEMSLTNVKIHIAYSICFSSRWFASHADWNLAICPSMRNVAFGLINGLRQHICSQDRKNTHCPSLSETPRGWKLLRVSEQRLIKRFGKSCPNFQLTLHLKYAYLPICINCLPTPGYHKTCIMF